MGSRTERDRYSYNVVEAFSRACWSDQSPLLLVFLNLRKAYDIVDCKRFLITLEGYGAGPCLCGFF